MPTENLTLSIQRQMSLALRLVLAILPAFVGIVSWGWLEKATGVGHTVGIHPLWFYTWHPPLMDVLFGAVVLASFVQARRRWWLRAAIIGLASFESTRQRWRP